MSKSEIAKKEVGRPLLFETAEEMQVAIDDYFATEAYMGEGEDKVFAPTVSGLALHLDMSRKSFVNYSNRDGFLLTIKRAREKIGAALEQRLYGNNVAGIIFNLKNNFDWKDKQEIEQTHSFKDLGDSELDAKIRELQAK